MTVIRGCFMPSLKKLFALSAILLITISASFADDYYRLKQKNQKDGVDFVIWVDENYNLTSDVFYQPIATIYQAGQDKRDYAYFNQTPEMQKIYQEYGKNLVNKNHILTNVSCVVMFRHNRKYYVGHAQCERKRGTDVYIYLELPNEKQALEILYILSYLKYYNEQNLNVDSIHNICEIKLEPLEIVTEGIESEKYRVEKVAPPETFSSVSINVLTYYNNEEIYARIKNAYGYYLYNKGNLYGSQKGKSLGMYETIYLDESGKETLEKEGEPTYFRKEFITKWHEVVFEKLP